MNPEPRVVILGAGFGGLDAARALARAPVRVTVLDRHNYHVFQPLLYQVATAALSPGDIASPIRWILRRQKNVEVLLADARAIDPAARLVLTDREPVPYDYLIVATGAAHAYFGHPEWERWAPGLKTLDDALEMRRRVLLAFEAAEREPRPRGAAAPADVRDHRRRADRRRAGGRARRDRPAVAQGRFPADPSRVGAHRAARRRTAPARHVSGKSQDGGPCLARASRRRGSHRIRP